MSLMKSPGGYVKVFMEGVCSLNGFQTQAGFGVFWGDNHPWNVCEPVISFHGRGGQVTRNNVEIQAAIRALQKAREQRICKLEINTDSRFLIDAVTKFMPDWRINGWRLVSGQPVTDDIYFKQLDDAMRFVEVRWQFVPACQGIHGNEMADQLAREGAKMCRG